MPLSRTRRAFFADAGSWLLAGAAGLLGLTACDFGGSRRLVLHHDFIPLWHPDCSGFFSGDRLTVSQPTGHDTAREMTLGPLESRLWCLCGGVLSEVELAETLARETGAMPRVATERVARFLDTLYTEKCLLATARGSVGAGVVHEIEGSTPKGMLLWRQRTL